MGIELENIINLLEEAIVEEDWTAIEQVLEILKSKVDKINSKNGISNF